VDSILYSHHVEIDEKAEPSVKELYMADDLGLVNGAEFFDSFQLADYFFFYEYIEAKTFIEGHAVIMDG